MNLLREKRTGAMLSQLELANKSGVNYKTISMIERGRISSPNQKTLRKLAEALDLPVDGLVALSARLRAEVTEASDLVPA